MKRYITTLLTAAMLTVSIPALATASFAQRQNCDSNNRQNRSENRRARNNDQRYQNDDEDYQSNDEDYQNNEQEQYYDESGYYQTNQPNVYRRHHKALNIAIATGAGAIIGALLGGKKGLLIGAGAGVAAGAIVTKRQNSNRYRRGY